MSSEALLPFKSRTATTLTTNETLFRTLRLGAVVEPCNRLEAAWRNTVFFLKTTVASTARVPTVGSRVGVRVVEEGVDTISSLRRRFILHPDDPVRAMDDLLLCLCVLLSVVEVPLAVGFSLDFPALTVFEIVTDCVFLLDIVRARAGIVCGRHMYTTSALTTLVMPSERGS